MLIAAFGLMYSKANEKDNIMNNKNYINSQKSYYMSCLLSNQNIINQNILNRTFSITVHLDKRYIFENYKSSNNRNYEAANNVMTPLYQKIIKSINPDNYKGRDTASVLISMDVEGTRMNNRKIQ